jgi:hypothetical protein
VTVARTAVRVARATIKQGARITLADGLRCARSFRPPIYLLKPFKTTDGGKHVVLSDKNDPPWGWRSTSAT